ncbi:MAG: phosphate ABC transporter substrate-binding protein [Desulfobacteraceae bacterium]|nr:phosphate ABC transporter substrate-binding protein [Desulfobacteraceae bacterium]MBC2754384.1 phosphate ABC transporter substrate-binding protein [Desulfobacteraceae bacterium]
MKMNFLKVLIVILSVFSLTAGAWAETLEIKGSTTVLPIAQKAAEAFMKIYPDVNVSVSGGGSGNGIKAIIDGTTDIADASRFIKDKEVALAVEKGVYPVPFGVAYDCIVPVVHLSNPIKNLTIDQLKDIYMGKIKNWKEIGGSDKKIVVISRDTSSGTYEVWNKLVMKKERVFPGALLQASNGAVAQAVAKNSYAVGYVGLSYLNKDLKALTVDGVKATAENAMTAAYPISRVLYMFTKGWPTGTTLKFINFVMHPAKGQKIVAEAGYVPLY